MRCSSVLKGWALVIMACGMGSEPNEGLDASVFLDRSRLVRGESVEITVRVSGGTLQGSSTCLTGYSVLDASGAVVAPGDMICTADLVTRSTGSSYVRRFTWAGFAGTGANGTPLPAGTYQIIGGPGPSGSVHTSVSDPVTLELVD